MRETRVKLHPITGAPLLPVGYRSNGQPILPILGGAEADATDEDTDETDETGSAGTEGDDSGDTDGTDSDEDDKPKNVDGLKSALEKERQQRRRAKRELAEARAELDKIKSADLGEKERAEKERDEATKQRDAAKEALKTQRIANAFLKSNKHAWHNPDRALSLVDLSDVEIDDEGTVDGLDSAIEALAKSDPYLIKSETDNDDDGKGGPTGTPVGTGRQTDKGKNDRATLEAKYPALRR